VNYYIYATEFEEFSEKVLEYVNEQGLSLRRIEIDKLNELTLDEGHLIVTGRSSDIKLVMDYQIVV
jgi:hypothetical protein